MSDEHQDLRSQLDAERDKVRDLQHELAKLQEHVVMLESQLNNYKPVALQWFKEHGPSREECERILQEMIDHPDSLVDINDLLRDLEQDAENDRQGDHAA
jgi:chromosome segregation ATPase